MPDTHVGRRQLLELLDWRERETLAWIIAGDFNALSDGVVVRAALDGGFELGCRKQRPWDTTNINGRRRKIDYLLYTTGPSAKRVGVDVSGNFRSGRVSDEPDAVALSLLAALRGPPDDRVCQGGGVLRQGLPGLDDHDRVP